MRVALLTREFPPTTYGGAGTYAEYLVGELRQGRTDVDVHCFGDPRPGAVAHREHGTDSPLGVLATEVSMADGVGGADVVNSHTWYTGMAGQLVRLRSGIPHVVSMHSVEPDRPWKAGRTYDLSRWSERVAIRSADAVTVVSDYMLRRVAVHYPQVVADRLFVVPGGVDAQAWLPSADRERLITFGLDPYRPYVLSVARLSRQKGIEHFLQAAGALPSDVQVVLVTSTADDPAVAAEVADQVARSGRVQWIKGPLARTDLIEVMAHAAVFCCSSVYEPFGLLNLEAMSCAVPVVAGRIGGIPEAVADGETGLLVDYDADDPHGYGRELMRGMRTLLEDAATAARMGRAGRERVLRDFTWAATANAMQSVYRATVNRSGR